MKVRKHIIKLLNLILVTFLIIITSCTDQSNVNKNSINIIPKPLKVEAGNGSFTIQQDTKIFVETNNKEAKDVAKYFADRIKTVIGYDLTIEDYDTKSNIDGAILFTTSDADTKLGDEG
ncbi:MAG: hypothetical protein GXO85_05300, partial [Chlorobi bacterium]|nr:hypothetical protein [Chlorobiota bacterium]